MFARPDNRNERQIQATPVSQQPQFPHRLICLQMPLYTVVSAKPLRCLHKTERDERLI